MRNICKNIFLVENAYVNYNLNEKCFEMKYLVLGEEWLFNLFVRECLDVFYLKFLMLNVIFNYALQSVH